MKNYTKRTYAYIIAGILASLLYNLAYTAVHVNIAVGAGIIATILMIIIGLKLLYPKMVYFSIWCLLFGGLAVFLIQKGGYAQEKIKQKEFLKTFVVSVTKVFIFLLDNV